MIPEVIEYVKYMKSKIYPNDDNKPIFKLDSTINKYEIEMKKLREGRSTSQNLANSYYADYMKTFWIYHEVKKREIAKFWKQLPTDKKKNKNLIKLYLDGGFTFRIPDHPINEEPYMFKGLKHLFPNILPLIPKELNTYIMLTKYYISYYFMLKYPLFRKKLGEYLKVYASKKETTTFNTLTNTLRHWYKLTLMVGKIETEQAKNLKKTNKEKLLTNQELVFSLFLEWLKPHNKVWRNGGIFEYESTLERNIFLNSNHTKTFYKGIYTMWRRYINSEFL